MTDRRQVLERREGPVSAEYLKPCECCGQDIDADNRNYKPYVHDEGLQYVERRTGDERRNPEYESEGVFTACLKCYGDRVKGIDCTNCNPCGGRGYFGRGYCDRRRKDSA